MLEEYSAGEKHERLSRDDWNMINLVAGSPVPYRR
jgi:hypothetical protein